MIYQNNPTNQSIWDRTIGQAFSWLNKQENIQENINIDNYSESFSNRSNATTSKQSLNTQSIPLNAYLTYVTLNLQLIMQGIVFNY